MAVRFLAGRKQKPTSMKNPCRFTGRILSRNKIKSLVAVVAVIGAGVFFAWHRATPNDSAVIVQQALAPPLALPIPETKAVVTPLTKPMPSADCCPGAANAPLQAAKLTPRPTPLTAEQVTKGLDGFHTWALR